MTPEPDPRRKVERSVAPGAGSVDLRLELIFSKAIRAAVRENLGEIPEALREEYEKALKAEIDALCTLVNNSAHSASERVTASLRSKRSELISESAHDGSLDSLLRQYSSQSEMLHTVYEAAVSLLRQDEYFLCLFVDDLWKDKMSNPTGYHAPGVLVPNWRGMNGRNFGGDDGVKVFTEALNQVRDVITPYLRSRDFLELHSEDVFPDASFPGDESRLCFTNETFLSLPAFYGPQHVGAIFIALPGKVELKDDTKQGLRLLAHHFAEGLAHIHRIESAEGGTGLGT